MGYLTVNTSTQQVSTLYQAVRQRHRTLSIRPDLQQVRLGLIQDQ
jgi:hypothetical protein